MQFVHEADVVRAIMFVLDHDLDGIFNVAGDGLLPWSEVAAICDKRLVPLPPVGRGLAASLLARVGVDLPPELIDLLTYGRGVDNRRLKAQGFEYRYTSAGAVRAFAEAARLRRTVGGRTDVPLRARRRAVLPPLPRRRPRPGLTAAPSASCRVVDQCQGSLGRL